MLPLLDLAARARLRLLVARELRNAGDVWAAYRSGGEVPPLRFRNGLTLYHGAGDAPVFLLFEIFANGCYRKRQPSGLTGAVIDIGANIGAFSLDCAFRFPEVRIDAYEPHPATFQTLKRNIDANGLAGRVRLFQEAVGGSLGTLALNAAGPSLRTSGYATEPGEPGERINVPLVDLATVIARAGGQVSYLKIDAEGAEADILERGLPALAGVREVFGEYHEELVPGVVARVSAALEAAGFRVATENTHRCGPVFHGERS